MDTQRLIFVILAAAQFAFWLVIAGRYQTPPAAADAVVVHYGRKLRMLGMCIAFGIPLLTILVFAKLPLTVVRSPVPLGVLLLIAGCFGGVLLWETQAVFITASPKGIVSLSPWRRKRAWGWHEIEQVRYSRLNQWLILHGPRQEVIRASVFLVGRGDLARTIVRHVSGMKCSGARKALERLAR